MISTATRGAAAAQFRSPYRFLSVMEKVYAQRRANVRLVVETWGVAGAARALKFKSKSRVSRMLGQRRNIGEVEARYVEWRFGLPRGWLDRDNDSVPAEQGVSPMFGVELVPRDVERIPVEAAPQPAGAPVAQQHDDRDEQQPTGIHGAAVYADSESLS